MATKPKKGSGSSGFGTWFLIAVTAAAIAGLAYRNGISPTDALTWIQQHH